MIGKKAVKKEKPMTNKIDETKPVEKPTVSIAPKKLVKGSAEAMEKMASLRAMRKPKEVK